MQNINCITDSIDLGCKFFFNSLLQGCITSILQKYNPFLLPFALSTAAGHCKEAK